VWKWVYTEKRRIRYGSLEQQVEAVNEGKIVVIDVEAVDFEVDETVMDTTDKLFDSQPSTQP
jgi:hypothetical protein